VARQHALRLPASPRALQRCRRRQLLLVLRARPLAARGCLQCNCGVPQARVIAESHVPPPTGLDLCRGGALLLQLYPRNAAAPDSLYCRCGLVLRQCH
jgi:hypothetical protein